MVCEWAQMESEDLAKKTLGHLNFLVGTSFLEETPSKAAAL
jgi:hypothetical protein